MDTAEKNTLFHSLFRSFSQAPAGGHFVGFSMALFPPSVNKSGAKKGQQL
jgi:hypothetical protein